MVDQLGDFTIQGIAHNTSFLQAVLSHERFRKGDISTNFIEQEWPAVLGRRAFPPKRRKSAWRCRPLFAAIGVPYASGQLPGRIACHRRAC